MIVNQRGDGILLGYYVTGGNWIYNNGWPLDGSWGMLEVLAQVWRRDMLPVT